MIGRRVFPKTSASTRQDDEMKACANIVRNIKFLLARMPSHSAHRRSLVQEICKNVTSSHASSLLNIDPSYLEYSRKLHSKNNTLLNDKYARNVNRAKVQFGEKDATREWAITELGQKSGNTLTDTYYLYHSKGSFYKLYVKYFVKVIAMFVKENPEAYASDEDLSLDKMAELSQFRKNVLMYKGKYLDKSKMKPRSPQVFWSMIKRKNGQGLKICKVKKLHDCEVCRELPAHQKLYKTLLEQRNNSQNIDIDRRNIINKKIRCIELKIERGRIHIEQFKHQRTYINREIRDKLQPNQVLVYQDYVSCYDSTGKKCKNLVLTLITKRSNSEAIDIRYIDNFYYGKSDANTTIQIWHQILKHTHHFDNYNDIFLSGDTGSGFRSVKLCWFYTTWVGKYGKMPHIHHLCPRHAYSLCDSHGQHVVQQEQIARAEGAILIAGADYADLVSKSKLQRTTAFSWKLEELSDPVQLPVSVLRSKLPGISKCCEQRYYYNNARGSPVWAEGIVLMRCLSGEGDFTYYDMRKDSSICLKCSKTMLRPQVKVRCSCKERRQASRSEPLVALNDDSSSDDSSRDGSAS